MTANTMRALVKAKPEKGLWMENVPVPEPGRHEVLCKVHSVAICGTDKELISGNFLKKGWPRGFPYTPGHVLVVPYREVADLDGLTLPGLCRHCLAQSAPAD